MAKKVVTTNGKRGGNLVGKPHYDKHGNPVGGVKAVVTDAGGKPVELEGGEVIINKQAVKKHWRKLSEINQSAGNGVPIHNPESVEEDYDVDVEEYEKGGSVIKFNRNRIPSGWIMSYAKKLKENHPEVWKMAGNHYGNQAFKNLERVRERGYWLDSEEWMYKKWRAFVARHKGNFRIEGVIAMLKWGDKVEKGWSYMKSLIEEEIKKKSKTSSPKEKKLEQGGQVIENKYKKKAYRTKSLKDAKAFSKKHREVIFSMILRDENTNAFIKSYILKKGEVFDALYKPIRINQRKAVYYYLESDDFDWSTMSSNQNEPIEPSTKSLYVSNFDYTLKDEFGVLNEAFKTDFENVNLVELNKWKKKFGSYKNNSGKNLSDVLSHSEKKGYINPKLNKTDLSTFKYYLDVAIEENENNPTPEPSEDKLALFLDYSKRNDLGINVAEENQFEIEMVSTILQDDLLTKEQTLELM